MFHTLDEEMFEGKGKDIFEKHKPLMEFLKNEQVFGIEVYENEYRLYELCDIYFNINLTPEICNKLSSFFADLGKYIEENKNV